jgi:hypothetical protein
MKYLLLILALLALSSCKCACGDDKQYAHPLMRNLPSEARFIKAYKDNRNDSLKNSHWIKYELEGECFLYSDWNNLGITKVDCKGESAE